jgi:hypothetical protein
VQIDAFEKSLRAFARRVAFEPFVVELLSGSRIQVNHPEAVAFNGGVAVYVAADGTPSLFDHESVARLQRVNGAAAS